MLTVILLVLALACFIVAAFSFFTVKRVDLIALGLAFWVAAVLFGPHLP